MENSNLNSRCLFPKLQPHDSINEQAWWTDYLIKVIICIKPIVDITYILYQTYRPYVLGALFMEESLIQVKDQNKAPNTNSMIQRQPR